MKTIRTTTGEGTIFSGKREFGPVTFELRVFIAPRGNLDAIGKMSGSGLQDAFDAGAVTLSPAHGKPIPIIITKVAGGVAEFRCADSSALDSQL